MKKTKVEQIGREIYFPISDGEFKSQIEEIWVDETYGLEKKPGGIYVDVGANVGMATMYFAQFASQVYAVEPNPEIYAALVLNTQHLPNVKTFNCALANGDGKDFLYANGQYDLPQTMFDRTKKDSGVNRAIVIDCMGTDSFFKMAGIGHVDVMKVDTEEAEYVIFPSPSFGKVAPQIDVVLGEAHISISGGFPEIIPVIMEEWGYQTTFPKLKRPNYRRLFEVREPTTGLSKKYHLDVNTIFVCKRP